MYEIFLKHSWHFIKHPWIFLKTSLKLSWNPIWTSFRLLLPCGITPSIVGTTVYSLTHQPFLVLACSEPGTFQPQLVCLSCSKCNENNQQINIWKFWIENCQNLTPFNISQGILTRHKHFDNILNFLYYLPGFPTNFHEIFPKNK